MPAPLDVITIGRSSVDFYGEQIGGRLEDMATFAKSVGGCPANIAIGASRLGLKAGLITRVGDEHMGRFIREQMVREGVATEGIRTDAERLTALVILGVRDERTFPLIFYRENCADDALCEDDVDPEFFARAAAVVVTGTHFSKPDPAAAQRKAMRLVRVNGGKVAFDIDYRPNLWGLAGHAAGEERYIASDRVSARLQAILPDCDLVVGTEEELMIAGGESDILASLRRVRELTAALIVLKRGPMGCVLFPGPIPERVDDGIVGRGFPVEVCNVLGAGDAFMAGFLRGWLKNEALETCATWANACGAFAVSRLLCSPESPTWPELQRFLAYGSPHRALRRDADLNHLHWATTRQPMAGELMVLAIDHRKQLEDMAEEAGAPRERISAFKVLAVRAAGRVGRGRAGYGVLLDGTYGREALFAADREGLWIGRPVEQAGSRPLRFETRDLGSHLAEWPVAHTLKCLCFYHPDDEPLLKWAQEEKLLVLHDAARTVKRELLIEIIAGRHGQLQETTVASVLSRLYDLGIRPDWWKLEAQEPRSWDAIGRVTAERDPLCRGVVVLGLDAPEARVAESLTAAARFSVVKGFAVGRTIFSDAARRWLAGRMSDDEAVADIAARFERLASSWTAARAELNSAA